MIFFLFCFIPVDLDYMASQNRVGLGRETFSFQFHFEKRSNWPKMQNCRIFKYFFSEIARQLQGQIWLVG